MEQLPVIKMQTILYTPRVPIVRLREQKKWEIFYAWMPGEDQNSNEFSFYFNGRFFLFPLNNGASTFNGIRIWIIFGPWKHAYYYYPYHCFWSVTSINLQITN